MIGARRLSLIDEDAQAAPGFGITAKASATGWTTDSSPRGDEMHSSALSIKVPAAKVVFATLDTTTDLAKELAAEAHPLHDAECGSRWHSLRCRASPLKRAAPTLFRADCGPRCGYSCQYKTVVARELAGHGVIESTNQYRGIGAHLGEGDVVWKALLKGFGETRERSHRLSDTQATSPSATKLVSAGCRPVDAKLWSGANCWKKLHSPVFDVI